MRMSLVKICSCGTRLRLKLKAMSGLCFAGRGPMLCTAETSPLFQLYSYYSCGVKKGDFVLRITPITEPAKPMYYWAVVVRGVDED
jgi:hypothetical protein